MKQVKETQEREEDDYDEEMDDCPHYEGEDCDCNTQDEILEEYGIKPSGQKFYNVRGEGGKFVKKEDPNSIGSFIHKAIKSILP